MCLCVRACCVFCSSCGFLIATLPIVLLLYLILLSCSLYHRAVVEDVLAAVTRVHVSGKMHEMVLADIGR